MSHTDPKWWVQMIALVRGVQNRDRRIRCIVVTRGNTLFQYSEWSLKPETDERHGGRACRRRQLGPVPWVDERRIGDHGMTARCRFGGKGGEFVEYSFACSLAVGGL